MAQSQEDRRAEAIRAGLAPLDFLLGQWRGEGLDRGEPLESSLVVTRILGDSFLEAREVTTDARTGVVVHEDRAIYRYDVDERRLMVTHLLPGAWYLERVVRVAAEGILWEGGPLAAAVAYRPVGGGLEVVVRFPAETEPDLVLRYQPVRRA
jgi:hypothetical protein